VLGDGVKQSLFGDEDAVGGQVFVGNTPFTVIGVMVPKNQNSSYNSRDTDRVFIPASTHRAVFGLRYISNLIYKTSTPEVHEAVEERVYQVLGRKYRFDPTDEDALMIWDTAEMMQFLGAFFLGFKIFMAIVGSFTLTVGGIGVANIMYIVVRERTREIGIRRSVGARKFDILLQFVAETFVIVGIGAALGFLISWALVTVAGAIGAEEFIGRPTISGQVAAVTVSLLAVIAFLAGLFPARRAANLDPVEAVRF
jgi:putative ABC transport system permease protein